MVPGTRASCLLALGSPGIAHGASADVSQPAMDGNKGAHAWRKEGDADIGACQCLGYLAGRSMAGNGKQASRLPAPIPGRALPSPALELVPRRAGGAGMSQVSRLCFLLLSVLSPPLAVGQIHPAWGVLHTSRSPCHPTSAPGAQSVTSAALSVSCSRERGHTAPHSRLVPSGQPDPASGSTQRPRRAARCSEPACLLCCRELLFSLPRNCLPGRHGGPSVPVYE